MGKSSVSTSVTVQLSNDLTDCLNNRAEKRGVSRSQYLSMLIQKWKKDGFPSVDAVDEAARLLSIQDETNAKARAGNKTPAEKQAASFRVMINKHPKQDEAFAEQMPNRKSGKRAAS